MFPLFLSPSAPTPDDLATADGAVGMSLKSSTAILQTQHSVSFSPTMLSTPVKHTKQSGCTQGIRTAREPLMRPQIAWAFSIPCIRPSSRDISCLLACPPFSITHQKQTARTEMMTPRTTYAPGHLHDQSQMTQTQIWALAATTEAQLYTLCNLAQTCLRMPLWGRIEWVMKHDWVCTHACGQKKRAWIDVQVRVWTLVHVFICGYGYV